MEMRIRKVKSLGEKDRLKQHIEYDLTKVTKEAEEKIKLKCEEYNYEAIKNLKPNEIYETKEQEIKRIWKTITNKIRKKLKEEYPKTKEKNFQRREGEEWKK